MASNPFNRLSSYGYPASVLVFLLVSAALVYFALQDVEKAQTQAKPWMNPVITREELRSESWVLANTHERDVFVTDIFGGEHLMGSTLREGTEGGDWAVAPNVVEKMGEINEFYKTRDPARAYQIAKKYGAKYVLVPNRQVFAGFEWLTPERTKLQDPRFFERAYADGEFEIYRVQAAA